MKLARNVARDAEVTEALSRDGWIVLRFWDFELERETDHCIEKIRTILTGAGQANSGRAPGSPD
jgi:very-short-patch-repair endonuclease